MSAGSLTTVMRAARAPVAAEGPLVLRVAVVRSGRIVEERVIKRRDTVSVGTHEDATFICEGARFDLFVRQKDGYVLRFGPGTGGRVSLDSEVVSLEALRARAPSKGGIHEIALTDASRGKVVMGDTTFLFQFVRPPPVSPRPQLPLAVKGSFGGAIDWPLTVIAAFSFLLHFGIVGAMYSDWMDEVSSDPHTVAGLVDLMKSIPAPAVTETPDPSTPATTPTENAPTKTSSQAKTSTTAARETGGKSLPHAVDDRQAASLVAQANQMEVGLVLGLTGKSSVERTLSRTEIPPVDLSARAASADGVTHGGSELNVHSGPGAVAAPGRGGITTLGGPVVATADGKAGDARTLAAPKVEPQIGALGGGATVTGADRVVAGLRGRFRACYQKGLAVDSTMSGKVVIAARIGPNGEVTSADVDAGGSAGLSPDVNACIAGVVKRAQFDPQATSTTLRVPVSFVQQR